MMQPPKDALASPEHPDVDDRPRPRTRLSAADEAAVNAVLEHGFDPARTPASAREAAVARLLGSLDRLPDADGPRTGESSIVDATLARIERFEDERTLGPSELPDRDDVVAVLPWYRNLIGAAAAIILLASMAIWSNAGSGGQPGPGTLAAAGVLELPEWDAAAARDYVETRPADRPAEGAIAGELWVLKSVGGRDHVVFVPDRARLAASATLRERGAVRLGRCLLRPQSPDAGPAAARPGD
jgi:hypothetical protein